MAGRFGTTTTDEYASRRLNVNSKNTRKANSRSANTLRSYLLEKGYTRVNFEQWSARELSDVLRLFYLDIRKVNGEKYKTSSLENFRHSLNRHIQSVNPDIDIMRNREFADANLSFRTMMTELKREGLGATEHYPTISTSDLQKMYQSYRLDIDTPVGLQNKVQFDIRLYFFRRGSENMHKMTKETFKIVFEPDTGYRYVSLAVDELTKNHGAGDRVKNGAAMPEMPGNPLCPVVSFKKYFEKLNPKCDRLWQRSKDSFLDDEETWYTNSPVGEKKLQKFMSDLSEKAGLSRRYTNHSIRATGATILSREGFNAAQIMSVTGHKSVSSLAVYQRVGDIEKISMGQAINNHVHNNDKQVALIPKAKPNNPTVEYADIRLDDMTLEDFRNESHPIVHVPINPLANNPSGGANPSFLSSLFSNCKVEHVTVNVTPAIASAAGLQL